MNKQVRIALVGNPNCGKTSLFNALTGLRQKVGNYPGVTVDKKIGYAHLSKDVRAELIDLPGTYSLYPKQIDEFITFDVLLNKENESYPDVILIVADASNMKRNLLFCSQIIDLGIPVVIALNMLDVAERNHIYIDIPALSEMLGVPVVPINAREGSGLNDLKKVLNNTELTGGKELIDVLNLAPSLIASVKEATQAKSNYAALQMTHHYMNVFCLDVAQKAKVKSLREEHNFNAAKTQAAEIIQRYGRINEIMDATFKQENKVSSSIKNTSRIDHYLTHPVWGYLIFLLIFFFIFQAVFSWAQYPMAAIDYLFNALKDSLHHRFASGVLTDLFVEGILSGIQGVAIFIPQIMILFGFISILEDTGYMSRISFLMDRLGRNVGLNGKSTVPLISGLACAIPAIMSTRNIENRKDRLITIMITPLMSCSARLPVYTLLVGFAVPHRLLFGIFNLQGLVMTMLYLFGFVMAILVAVVLKFIIKSTEKGIFVMELPIYRWPRWSNVGITMVEKAKVFVTDAGKVIVAISVVLWFLAAFGPGKEIQKVEEKYNNLELQSAYTPVQLDNMKQSEKLQYSYAGHIGRFIEPVIAPLGFDWKMGIAIITAFAAREVFVGTMSTIYSVGSDKESAFGSLRDKMREDINPRTGKHVFTGASAFSLIIFFVLAMQCMSTLAVVKRETKTWKWPVIQFVYMTGLAWICSFITYQLLK